MLRREIMVSGARCEVSGARWSETKWFHSAAVWLPVSPGFLQPVTSALEPFMQATRSSKTAVRSYRDLKVCQVGMDLVVESYRLAKLLPRDEQYGLVSRCDERPYPSRRTVPKGTGETISAT